AQFPDVPPLVLRVDTATRAVSADSLPVALPVACSCPEFTNVVVRLAPFQLTTDPLTNPLPFTVRVNAAPPAVADDGDSELIEGGAVFDASILQDQFHHVRPLRLAVNTVICTVAA